MRYIISILLLLCSTAKAQVLLGLQGNYVYNHTKLYNSFDAKNTRGMKFKPSFYQQMGAGLSGYFKDKYVVELGVNKHRAVQEFTFDRPDTVVVPWNNYALLQIAHTYLLYRGITLTASRLFGTYERRLRLFAGMGFSYNNLHAYQDYHYISNAAIGIPTSQTFYFLNVYDGYMHQFNNSSGSNNGNQYRDLNKWLYKKQDMRIMANIGMQLQVSPHVFLLLGVQAQHSLASIETEGEITSFSKQFQNTYKGLGLQERYTSKYESLAPVKGALRNTPTYVQVVGGNVGLRFQFGRWDR
jgi:hypothetical protein